MKLKAISLIVVPCLFITGCSTLQTENDKQKEIIHRQKILISELDETNSFLKKKNDELKSLAGAATLKKQGQDQLSELDKNYAEKMTELMNSLSSMGVSDGDITTTRHLDATVITLQEKVLFNSGESKLSENGKAVLKKLVTVIHSKYPTNDIRIEGHTDTDPVRLHKENSSNWELSAKRAARVVEFLDTQKTIPANKLSIGAYGPNRPVSPGASKQLNRRVEIAILDNK